MSSQRIQFAIQTLKRIEQAVIEEPGWDHASEGRIRAVVDLYISGLLTVDLEAIEKAIDRSGEHL